MPNFQYEVIGENRVLSRKQISRTDLGLRSVVHPSKRLQHILMQVSHAVLEERVDLKLKFNSEDAHIINSITSCAQQFLTSYEPYADDVVHSHQFSLDWVRWLRRI